MVIGTCTAGAECVGLTKSWATIYFFGSYISIMLLLLLFWIFWKTPALEYIIAIITGKSLVLVTNRSNQGKIRTAKPNAEGILDIKKVGPVLVSENSNIVDKISGRPLYIVHGEFASTIPTWWVSVVNFLKKDGEESGKPLHHAGDYADKIGLKFNETSGRWEKKDDTTESKEIRIEPYRTLNLSQLANMFPYNITPALVESDKEYALAKQMKFWKTDTGKIMIYAMVLIIVVIAGYLALKLYPTISGGNEVHIITERIITANQSMVS